MLFSPFTTLQASPANAAKWRVFSDLAGPPTANHGDRCLVLAAGTLNLGAPNVDIPSGVWIEVYFCPPSAPLYVALTVSGTDRVEEAYTPVAFSVGPGEHWIFARVGDNWQAFELVPGADYASSPFGYRGALGLNAVFGGGELVFADGATASFAGGSVALQPSATNFVMLDLHDLTLHALRKGVHTGAVLLATITTGASAVSTCVQPTAFRVPESCVERAKRKAAKSNQPLYVAVIGDSLSKGAGGTPYWHQLLFDDAQAGGGYNVPNVSNWTKLNYASGGQTAHYGWSMFGLGIRSGYTGLNQFTQSGVHYDAVQALEARGLNLPGIRSPILTHAPDLAIIGFGANGGTYNLGFLENMVRELRERGVEVILHTSNFNTGNLTGLVGQIDDIARIAEAYGCDVADTNSYLFEAYSAGGAVFADAIHPSAAGHVVYAAAMRSLLNDRRQHARVQNDGCRPRLFTVDSATYAGRFPNDVHVNFASTPTGFTGDDVASVSSSAVENAAILFGGKVAATGTIEIAAGETGAFHHSGFLAMDILFEQDSAFTLELRTGGGATLQKTITHVAGNNSIGLKEALSLTETAALGGYIDLDVDDWMANAGIEFRVTAGVLKLIGAVFHVVKQRTLRWNEIAFRGTWAQETCNALAASAAYYTDTLNDSCHFEVEGSGCQVLMQRKSAGGQITVYVDGKQYGAVIDLYRASGQYVYPLNIDFAGLGNVKDRGYGRHLVRLVYSGTNGSAAAASAGDRRLTIGAIKELDAR